MEGAYLLPLRTSAGVAITGAVKAGFSLTYYVDGVDTATTDITITEVGTSGDYTVYVPDAATSTDHTLLIEDGGALGVPAGWMQSIVWPRRPDVADLISAGGTISYDGPVATTGDVEIIRGDDYMNADGRALAWSDTSWPTLTGGSILLSVRDVNDNLLIDDAPGVVVSASSIYIELTAVQTTVAPELHRFDVQATLASGSVVTLQRGRFRVWQEQTRA